MSEVSCHPSEHRLDHAEDHAQDHATGHTPGTGLSAVVFDYGNVLYAWDAYGALPGEATIAQWEEFVEAGDFARWNAMCDAGVPLADIAAELARTYPDRPDWLALQQMYWRHFDRTLIGPVPGVAQVVEELAGQGVPLYLLTNFNDRLFHAHRHLCPQLDLFSGVVVSGEEHTVKPGPEIFRIVLGRYGLRPEQTLFVDDTAANVAAAQSLGLRGHLFRGAGRLRAVLTEEGLLPGAPRL